MQPSNQMVRAMALVGDITDDNELHRLSHHIYAEQYRRLAQRAADCGDMDSVGHYYSLALSYTSAASGGSFLDELG